MGAFTEASRLPEFERDIRRLLKRFKTIEDDLEIFIEKQLFLYHKLEVDNKGIFQIIILVVDGEKLPITMATGKRQVVEKAFDTLKAGLSPEPLTYEDEPSGIEIV